MNLSKIFTTAHAAMKQSAFTADWSYCLIGAWNKERARMDFRASIIDKLKAGIVAFRYTKADGTVRMAFGTLDKQFINYEAKGKAGKESVELVRYWDLTKNQYRMFKLDSFIEFISLEFIGSIIAMVIGGVAMSVDIAANIEYIRCEVAVDEFGDTDLISVSVEEGIQSFRLEHKREDIASFITACYNTKV